MCRLRRQASLVLATVVGFSATFTPETAHAAPILVVNGGGILTGAKAVTVDGHLYDVEFVEGTCTAVFGICDEAHFAFTTESAALAASKALGDYIFLDVPGLGNFDSEPMSTNGCFFPANCWALTPYKILGDNFLIAQALNSAVGTDDGFFLHQPNGPGLSIFGSATETIYDSSVDINGVFAKWTPVPDCSPFPGRGHTDGCFPGPGPFPAPEPAITLLIAAGIGAAVVKRRFKWWR